MATFNGASHLEEQLASLANQTLLPHELVVTDDGSTDGTIDILRRFSQAAPFGVHIYQNDARLGYRANFIKAANLCKGDLISFCDQDDIWFKDNLFRVMRSFERLDVLLVYHNAHLIDAGGKDLGPFYADPPGPEFAARLTLSPWAFSYGLTQTFRSSLLSASQEWTDLSDINRPGEAMGHDLFFFLLALSLGTVCYIDERLVDYRQHAGNVFGAGIRSRPGLITRWRYRLEDRSHTYHDLSGIAVRNNRMFSRLAENPAFPQELRGRATVAAAAWQLLVTLYADRAEVCSGSFPKRIGSFIRLQRRHGYDETGYWTFGSKAAVKDIILGVILAPLVRRYGMTSSKTDPSCRRGRLTLADDLL